MSVIPPRLFLDEWYQKIEAMTAKEAAEKQYGRHFFLRCKTVVILAMTSFRGDEIRRSLSET